MLNRDADSPTTREELIPNFRVFTPSEVGGSMYAPPLTKSTDSPRFMLYMLVSIMNSLFTDELSAKHMISEAQVAYGDFPLPTIYACGDTIYNITKEYLFNMKGKTVDPVADATKKWNKQYNKAIEYLQSEGVNVEHECISWSAFENIEEYRMFRKFTDAIVNAGLTLEKLQAAFPEVSDTEVISALFLDVQQQHILENIADIAENYAEKNAKKLKVAANSEKKQQKNALAALKKFNGHDAALGEVLTLEQRKEGLLSATYTFLSNEYAVFLLLAHLTNTSLIKEKLGLKSAALDTPLPVTPILSYPISSTLGADLTFTTFLKINHLYCKYSTSLALPETAMAIFVDSLVPTTLNPHDKKRSSGESDQSDASVESESSSSNGDEAVSPSVALNQATSLQPEPPVYKSGRSSPVMFTDAIEVIVQRVTETLSQHWKKTQTIACPHGVTCTITCQGKVSSLSSESGLLENVQEQIRVAAKTAIRGFSEIFSFDYNGYSFELKTQSAVHTELGLIKKM